MTKAMRRSSARRNVTGALVLAMAMAIGGLTACDRPESREAVPQTNQAAYAVVSVDEDTDIDTLFDYSSKSQVAVSDISSSNETKVYTYGILDNGASVVWYSGDDNYGYDDRLFVYVEDEVSEVSWYQWTRKLDETPITLEEFEERF